MADADYESSDEEAPRGTKGARDEEHSTLLGVSETSSSAASDATTAADPSSPQSSSASGTDAAASPAGGGPTLTPSTTSRERATLAILFWLAASTTQILFNKSLFVGKFSHPITLTSIHMLTAGALTAVAARVGWLAVPSVGWRTYGTHILPISALMAAALAAGNVAALRLPVSFVHFLKAGTPVVIYAVSVAARVAAADSKLAAIVAVITVGVLLASIGELAWDSVGVALQLCAMVFESARLVVMQRVMQELLPKSNPLASLALFAPAAGALLVLTALILEPDGYATLGASKSAAGLVAANTATALVLNVAVTSLVAATSGLTLVLSGTVKDVLVIAASMALFGNEVTSGQAFGYGVALFGLLLYHNFKAEPSTPMPVLLRRAACSLPAAGILAASVAAAVALVPRHLPSL